MKRASELRSRVIVPAFVRDVGILTAAGNVRLALGLLQALLVARWLGPHNYGRSVLILALPELIFGLVDLRGSEATIRFLQRFRQAGQVDACRSLCWLGFSADVAVAIVTVMGLVIVGAVAPWGVLRHGADAHLVYFYAATFLLRGLAPTSLAVLTVGARYRQIARYELISAVGRAALVLTSVAAGAGVAGVVVGNGIYGMLRALVLLGGARKASHDLWGTGLVERSLAPLRGHLREIFRFMAFGDAAGTLAVLVKQGDVVIIGAWLGPSAAGTYRIAKNLPDLVGIVSGPLQTVAYERLSGMTGRGDLAGIRSLIRRMTLTIGVPIAAVAMLSIIVVPRAVAFLAGPGYRAAIGPGSLFIASSCIGLLLFWLRPLHLAIGEPGIWAFGNFASMAVYAAVGLPLLGAFGIMGLAAGFLIANLVPTAVLALRQWGRMKRWAVA